MTFVDLTPILEAAVGLGAATLLGVGSWAAKRAADWIGIGVESNLARRLQDAVSWSVAYGANRALREGADLARIDVRNAVVADALTYLGDHVPDTVRRLGLTERALAEMVEARLSN